MSNPDSSELATLASILPWPAAARPSLDETRRAIRNLQALKRDVARLGAKTDRLTIELAIADALGTSPTPDRRRQIGNLLLTLAEEQEDQAQADEAISFLDDGC